MKKQKMGVKIEFIPKNLFVKDPKSHLKKYLILFSFEVLLAILILCLIEGALSWYHFFKAIHKNNIIAEDVYSEYDPLLGWISKPNIFIKNMYGEGKNVTITPDRLRLTPKNPNTNTPGLICTGDSFTFGYGVDDSKTWCSLLAKNDFQTFNMGQGGYGLDQNYLWYLRDGESIQHKVHVMAFILDDFGRTNTATFIGYGKPFFQLVDGELTNINYPVPKPSGLLRFLTINQTTFMSLHVVQTAGHQFEIVTGKKMSYRELPGEGNKQSDAILTKLIHEMVKLTLQRKAKPVIVLLPNNVANEKGTYMANYTKYKKLLTDLAEKDHFIFVDVGANMLQEDSTTYNSFFITQGAMKYVYAEGHYTNEGHAYVAKIVSSAIQRYVNIGN